jgi:hypothetical protein
MRIRNCCFLAVVLAIASHALSQELPKEEFAIRESIPQTGTSIRKDVAWSSAVPINRTYAQLRPEHRQVLHNFYERIEPGDEPPFPADGLKPLMLALWNAQSRYLAKGNLTVVADVDVTGTVTKVDAYEAPDPELTKLVASILLLTKFKPATCKGVPCRMQYPFALKLDVQ